MSNCKFEDSVGLNTGTWIWLFILFWLFVGGANNNIIRLEEKLNMVIRAHSGLTEQQLNDLEGKE